MALTPIVEVGKKMCQCDDFITVVVPGGIVLLVVNNQALSNPAIRLMLISHTVLQVTANSTVFMKTKIPPSKTMVLNAPTLTDKVDLARSNCWSDRLRSKFKCGWTVPILGLSVLVLIEFVRLIVEVSHRHL
jgi:hypothetical protein